MTIFEPDPQVRDLSIGSIALSYRIERADHYQALRNFYDVVYRHFSPFVSKISCEILDDLDGDPSFDENSRLVCLERDGRPYAINFQAIRPELSGRVREVTASRLIVERALQDREKNAGVKFPQLEGFRHGRTEISAQDVTGASLLLTRELAAADVLPSATDIGRPKQARMVDIGIKGTIQEALAALYPETQFLGHYAMYFSNPSDPHPGTKKGYELHVEGPRPWWPRGHARIMPEDPKYTFAHLDAVKAIEDILCGPWASATHLDENGPVRERLRYNENEFVEINPLKVSLVYQHRILREASRELGHHAVADFAQALALSRNGVASQRGRLVEATDEFRELTRDWVLKRPVDPTVQTVLDSFVRRCDYAHVKKLNRHIRRQNVPVREAVELWHRLDGLETDAQRDALILQLTPDPPLATKVRHTSPPGIDKTHIAGRSSRVRRRST